MTPCRIYTRPKYPISNKTPSFEILLWCSTEAISADFSSRYTCFILVSDIIYGGRGALIKKIQAHNMKGLNYVLLQHSMDGQCDRAPSGLKRCTVDFMTQLIFESNATLNLSVPSIITLFMFKKARNSLRLHKKR